MTETGPARKLRVLVVDDELLIRWSVVETLAGCGHCVREASDAGAAIDAVREAREPFDVALLDLRLPDSSDLSLLAKVRALMPSMVVVVMTAFGAPDIVAGARALGAYDVVSKPFDMHGIERLLLEADAARTTLA
jgi:DNA-binding NtrC family response regulator